MNPDYSFVLPCLSLVVACLLQPTPLMGAASSTAPAPASGGLLQFKANVPSPGAGTVPATPAPPAHAAVARSGAVSMPGEDLQAVLDRGEDLLLAPGRTYEISAPLRYARAGQRIATAAPPGEDLSPAHFAVLRCAPGPLMTLVDGAGTPDVVLERVWLDGRRETMAHPDGKVPGQPFTSWGKRGGERQRVRRCVIVDARCGGGWAAVHVHEGGGDVAIEDNLIFGAGVDARGSGRATTEAPFGWGDGISTASPRTLVRNNLIVDATDDGVMVQGAPGTCVEGNTILAVSREMLGGIALIDPFAEYRLPGEGSRFDYRGVVVRGNRIEALGAWIHIGIALGGGGWNQRFDGHTLVGARVEDNTLAGEAFGYGIVANGVDGFTVRGNISLAEHSGRGDGVRQGAKTRIPEPAAPFLFDASRVGSSDLQKEFLKAQGHLFSLLRAWPPPADPLGYRVAVPAEPEARGVVRWAWREMIGGDPSPEQLARLSAWLRANPCSGDAVRLRLAEREEFRRSRGQLGPALLQSWRKARWREALLAAWTEALAAGTGDVAAAGGGTPVRPTPASALCPRAADLWSALARRL